MRSGSRIVQLNRRTHSILDETAIVKKFGVSPHSIPDYLSLVGDSADGYSGLPGWAQNRLLQCWRSFFILSAFLRTAGNGALMPQMRAPWRIRSAASGIAQCFFGGWPATGGRAFSTTGADAEGTKCRGCGDLSNTALATTTPAKAGARTHQEHSQFVCWLAHR